MVVERKVAICNISLVDSIEYNKIVNLWNTTKKIYPKHKNIHILFEENVKKILIKLLLYTMIVH